MTTSLFNNIALSISISLGLLLTITSFYLYQQKDLHINKVPRRLILAICYLAAIFLLTISAINASSRFIAEPALLTITLIVGVFLGLFTLLWHFSPPTNFKHIGLATVSLFSGGLLLFYAIRPLFWTTIITL